MDRQFVVLKSLILDPGIIWAHLEKDAAGKVIRKELLTEHLEITRSYLELLIEQKGLAGILKRLAESLECKGEPLTAEAKGLVLELFINAVYLHDLGKLNPYFQQRQMKNPSFQNLTIKSGRGEHSLLSAVMFIDLFSKRVKKFPEQKQRKYFRDLLYTFAFIISRHHTYLKDLKPSDFLSDLNSFQAEETNDKYLKNYLSSSWPNLNFGECNLFAERNKGLKEETADPCVLYILTKLLFSLLVAADYYATYEFFAQKKIELGLLTDVKGIRELYRKSEVYQGILAHRKNPDYFEKTPINHLRSQLFDEAEKNLLANLDHNIFYLEAPTGGGKTNISINLALQLLTQKPEFQKVFYIFPFNTLVEQTKETFDEIFGDALQHVVINSITPVLTREEEAAKKGEEAGKVEEWIDYDRSYIDRQFLHYPVVLTTHINFFNWLFGVGKEANFPLVHLCNSVVILDEIQSYSNVLWNEIILFFDKYAKLLNLKIIIMSATLPRLDRLLVEKESLSSYVNLIQDSRLYYQNPLFKNRVNLHFELLNEKEFNLQRLKEVVCAWLTKRPGRLKILIEFIKKDTARNFYNLLEQQGLKQEIRLVELTGDDNKYQRERILKQIKKEQRIIVIATQVIEAGVDIDMDIGYKNISILDSEEQFLGRINRSCLATEAHAYFFCLDLPNQIYRGDYRTTYNILAKEYQELLKRKDFGGFYEKCLSDLKEHQVQTNEKNIRDVLDKALYLKFEQVQQKMQLIKERNVQIYLPYIIEEMGLDGFRLWEDYKELSANRKMKYSKKQIKFSQLIAQMTFFTYNLVSYSSKQEEIPFVTEKVGPFYYIAEADRFLTTEKKFDREKYKKEAGKGDLFL